MNLGRPRNRWKRELEKEMEATGLKYNWKKTGLDGEEWSLAYDLHEVTRLKEEERLCL